MESGLGGPRLALVPRTNSTFQRFTIVSKKNVHYSNHEPFFTGVVYFFLSIELTKTTIHANNIQESLMKYLLTNI